MKKVELKVLDVDGEAKIDYREQIITVLKAPENPQAGLDFEEMSKVLPIIDKVQSAGAVVLLEDAEHEEVSRRLKKARFGVAHPALFDMIKAITEAPVHLVEADAKSQ